MNENNTTETEKKELTTQQKVNKKIKELKKITTIESQITSLQAKIEKLELEKLALEEKYGL